MHQRHRCCHATDDDDDDSWTGEKSSHTYSRFICQINWTRRMSTCCWLVASKRHRMPPPSSSSSVHLILHLLLLLLLMHLLALCVVRARMSPKQLLLFNQTTTAETTMRWEVERKKDRLIMWRSFSAGCCCKLKLCTLDNGNGSQRHSEGKRERFDNNQR